MKLFDKHYFITIFLIGLALFFYSLVVFKVTHASTRSGRLIDLPRIEALPTKKILRHAEDVSQTLRVAIIDTGFDDAAVPDGMEHLKICPEGSYDFVSNKPGVAAAHWHGTVTGTLIAEGLKDVNYCALIYQVATESGQIPDEALIAAAKAASKANVAAVNLSLGGFTYSQKLRFALSDIIKSGAVPFIAAGNMNQDLTPVCSHYPACHRLRGMYVVGATDGSFLKSSYSNFGVEVNAWYPGNVNFGGELLQGTSFATPRALADYVSALSQSTGT